MENISVCHLTSAHPRYDVRIFLKECRSLALRGVNVSLVVADGLPDEERDGVKIFGVPKLVGRLRRMLYAPGLVVDKALKVDADIYHLHDPELLKIGRRLKRAGKRVVFDAHEDLPKQVLTKTYLWPPVRRLLAFVIKHYEAYVCGRIDAVVAATPAIHEKFRKINPCTVAINNFPLTHEFASTSGCASGVSDYVCYVGGITQIRGILQVIDAIGISNSPVRLKLAGSIGAASLASRMRASVGWRRVDELGNLSRVQVGELLSGSIAGIVTFLPAPNHIEAQPNKMFEYMSAGLPVIASSFPLWREIIEGSNCGICVDPLKPTEIADAINWLSDNPDLARRMGENGRKAVESKYNWGVEEGKLLALYLGLSWRDDQG